MKKMFFALATIVVLVLLSGCAQYEGKNGGTTGGTTAGTGGTSGTSVASGTVKVKIKDFKFVPETVTVKKGSAVEWTNLDSVAHTATSSGNFDSGLLQQGQSWSKAFGEAGTFDYACTPHPWMKGKVVVVE